MTIRKPAISVQSTISPRTWGRYLHRGRASTSGSSGPGTTPLPTLFPILPSTRILNTLLDWPRAYGSPRPTARATKVTGLSFTVKNLPVVGRARVVPLFAGAATAWQDGRKGFQRIPTHACQLMGQARQVQKMRWAFLSFPWRDSWSSRSCS